MEDKMIEDFLEIVLKDRQDFLKIAETLTRIGIVSKNKELVQTCHILHKRGKYYITHFKELFKLDGVSKTDMNEEDILRRNGIANLLQQWKLCEVVNAEKYSLLSLQRVKIVPYHQKHEYTLKQNYTVGNSKNKS
jgi:hypothetical protein